MQNVKLTDQNELGVEIECSSNFTFYIFRFAFKKEIYLN